MEMLATAVDEAWEVMLRLRKVKSRRRMLAI
jgi:hypothetical protein